MLMDRDSGGVTGTPLRIFLGSYNYEIDVILD
jgi:hypothetical protein